MISENLLDAIGGTPLVRLALPGAPACYAKLEIQNLFAMKDRVARNILLRAKESGALTDGAPIVESSSGTMALGVALVGTLMGHSVHIVTDPRIDRITLAKLESLGCEVHVVPEMDEHGWQGARLKRLAEIMAANPEAFWPRQYENPDNPAAYRTLADELITDLGRIDILVGSVGSGGSLCGTARALRETLPDLRVVGIDCVGSVLFGQPDWPQRLQSGLGNSMHPKNLDHGQIDEVHWLNDREAFEATMALARDQKLFAGNTSGSVYRVMTHLAEHEPSGTRIVGIFPDRGDRYAETVHNKTYWAERGLPGQPLATRPRQVPPGTVVESWAFSRLTEPDAERPVLAFVESNTTGTGMAAIGIARRLGYEPIFLTGKPDRYPGLPETGCRVLRCDTGDPGALAAALDSQVPRRRISAVTTTSEFSLSTAARLAAELGLPAERPEVIDGCRNKAALRHRLDQAGLPQPLWVLVDNVWEVAAAVDKVGLPCVVKPVDESGSTGVVRCDTTEQALDAVEAVLAVRTNVRGMPRARGALIESYVDGLEYSVEMFAVDGDHELVALVRKSVTGEPNFVESRHIVPASVPEEAARRVAAVVRDALRAAGLTRGASHTEVKITESGPVIIEINPRLAGGMIPELIRLASGVDLLEQQVRQACGLPVTLPSGMDSFAGIQFLTTPDTGVLTEVSGVEQAQAVAGVQQVTVTAKPGREVAPPVDAYGRLGYVIATAPNREDLIDVLATASQSIHFTVNPKEER
uniref:Cysteine synthase n=1 Tax=uncultured bacterium esnapd2 TaxID=1366601 RepID=S5TKB8_9BACT|nr:cysteine synthase [uncultured bacterium esnapd2]